MAHSPPGDVIVKAWVWQGENVLRNYGAGLVVVAAPSADDAWNKLKRERPDVWFHLTYGSTLWVNLGVLGV